MPCVVLTCLIMLVTTTAGMMTFMMIMCGISEISVVLMLVAGIQWAATDARYYSRFCHLRVSR